MKELAVILLNWNGLELLKKFLPGVVRYTLCSQADVVVVDNGSTDGSCEWVEKKFPEVKLIRFTENHGFAEGYNLAISRCADYRFINLLNSDVEVTEGWWQPLVSYLRENPDCGAVQPKIGSYRDKKMFEYAGAAGGYLDALGYPFCRGRLFDSVEEDKGQYDGPAIDVAWASGACLTLPREVYIKAGGLDSKFFAHMEEIDLCCRIWRLGLRVAAITDSKVYHVGGASLQQGNPMKTYLNFRNNLLLLYKNLPQKRGRKLLFIRRLADTLAWVMFLVKLDFANAGAILKAHRDFKKMRSEYSPAEGSDVLAELPGAHKYAVIARHLLRRKSLNP